MKQLTVSKTNVSHDLSHLYEHIFFIHADTILRNRGWHAPLDYSLDGITEDGCIEITLKLYRHLPDSDELFDEIKELDIDFEMEITEIALSQLESEYGRELLVLSKEQLLESLEKLHAKPWVEQGAASSGGDVVNEVLVQGAEVVVIEARVAVSLNTVAHELAPLMRQVAGLVINTYVSDLADTYGGFVASSAYQVTREREVEGIVVFKDSEQINGDHLHESFEGTIAEIQRDGAFGRLLEMLRNIDKAEEAPSAENTYRDTGIHMSPSEWRAISSDENCSEVLEAIKREYVISLRQ